MKVKTVHGGIQKVKTLKSIMYTLKPGNSRRKHGWNQNLGSVETEKITSMLFPKEQMGRITLV